jgi:hypothetical protein
MTSKTFDVSRLFHPGKVDKIKLAIVSLEESLLSSSDKQGGWIRADHFKAIEKRTLFLYLSALLSARLLENSELIASLVQAVNGDAEPASWTVDEWFIRSVMVNPKKGSQRDVIITDDGVVDLLRLIENPSPMLAYIEEENSTQHNTQWLRLKWFPNAGLQQTTIEDTSFLVLLFCFYSTANNQENLTQGLRIIENCWGSNKNSIITKTQRFITRSIVVKQVTYVIPRARRQWQKKGNDDDFETCADMSSVGDGGTPARTRAWEATFGSAIDLTGVSPVNHAITPTCAAAPPTPSRSPPVHNPTTIQEEEATDTGASIDVNVNVEIDDDVEIETDSDIARDGVDDAPLLWQPHNGPLSIQSKCSTDAHSDGIASPPTTPELGYEEDSQHSSISSLSTHRSTYLLKSVPRKLPRMFCSLQSDSDKESDDTELLSFENEPRKLDSSSDTEDDDRNLPTESPRTEPTSDGSSTQNFYYDDYDSDINDQIEHEIAVDKARKEATQRTTVEIKHKAKARHALNLLENVCHLAAVGTFVVRTIMNALLVVSMPNVAAAKYLLESGYSSKRQEKVIKHKAATNKNRRRKAERRAKTMRMPVEEPTLIPEVSVMKFSKPLSDHTGAMNARLTYQEDLAQGRDIRKPKRPTSVSVAKIDRFMRWVTETCQYRPGKQRNVRFKKERVTLKGLPVFMRFGSLRSNFEGYCSVVADGSRVGWLTFRTLLGATTLKGTYNQGLSYFYVDFLDLIKLMNALQKRLEFLLKSDQRISKEDRQEALDWIDISRENTKLTSEYLRHGFYVDIKKSSDNGFFCSSHALGAQCDHQHTYDKAADLNTALSNHVLLAFVIDFTWNTLQIQDSDMEELSKEYYSMHSFALLAGLETLHYVKHIMRRWWQDTAIKELKKLLRLFPWMKGFVTDHKNKLLPRMKNEPMSLFFSKSGVSLLGAMIFWAAEREVKGQIVAGLGVWFVDIVMSNTSSQEARDLMPGLEAIRTEVQQDYFVDMAGATKGLFCLSDNALVSAAHVPFIHALNNKSLGRIVEGGSGDDETTSQADGQADGQADDGQAEDGQADDSQANDSQANDSQANDSQANDSGDQPTSDEVLGRKEQIEDRLKQVEAYVSQARKQYSGRVANWQSTVEPWIFEWLTWEAQCCKTELDTHFAYLNKQLTEACLQGGIDYLDPQSVFEALCYNGGATATTSILLEEKFEEAQDVFEKCNSVLTKKDRGGINSVHHQAWALGELQLMHYSNITENVKKFVPNADWPVDFPPTGKLLKRHISPTKPNFIAFKDELLTDDGADDEMKRLDMSLLPGRIYKSFIRHASDIAFSTEDDEGKRVVNKKRLEKMEKMGQIFNRLANDHPEVYDQLGATHPATLESYWAKKKNRTYLSLSNEVIQILRAMFKRGQGVSNKGLKYSAEEAVHSLKNGILKCRWDQLLCCSISKVKSFFGRKHREEESENDQGRRRSAQPDEANHQTPVRAEIADARQARADSVLEENQECERKLLLAMGRCEDSELTVVLEEATMEDFSKIRAPLLAAFIKCREMSDLGSPKMMAMPKKGNLTGALHGEICSRTGKKVMILWAFEIRMKAPGKCENVADTMDAEEVDREMYSQAVNDQHEEAEVVDYEDAAHNLESQRMQGIQEVYGDEEDGDDDASVGSSESSGYFSVGDENPET